jgi:hypothetical protein
MWPRGQPAGNTAVIYCFTMETRPVVYDREYDLRNKSAYVSRPEVVNFMLKSVNYFLVKRPFPLLSIHLELSLLHIN